VHELPHWTRAVAQLFVGLSEGRGAGEYAEPAPNRDARSKELDAFCDPDRPGYKRSRVLFIKLGSELGVAAFAGESAASAAGSGEAPPLEGPSP
jgi:hypothetical protein